MAVKRQSSFNSTSFLAKVGKGRSLGKYRKGQVVFSQGDAGDAVFYVQKGRVKITVVSEQGKEAVVAILGTDDFFGEGCLAGQVQRISTVTAMTDLYRPNRKGGYYPRDPSRTNVRRDVHCPSFGSNHPCRGGSGRSAVQFE